MVSRFMCGALTILELRIYSKTDNYLLSLVGSVSLTEPAYLESHRCRWKPHLPKYVQS